MGNINEVYGGKFLRAEDVPEGQPLKSKIEKVSVEDFEDKRKIVLSLDNNKRFVVNSTNAKRIAKHHGEDFEAWTGKEIEIERSETEFAGKDVACLRVVRKKE